VTDESLPAIVQAAIRYWWLFLIQGLVAIAVGVLLIAKPDKTVTFVAVVLGLYIIFFGLIRLASVFVVKQGTGAHIVIGLLALIAGGVIVVNPEKTVNLIVIFIGIYLLIWGLFALMALFGDRADKGLRAFQGLISAAAGIVVIAWPGPSVTVVAVVIGIYLILDGLLEAFASLQIKRLASG